MKIEIETKFNIGDTIYVAEHHYEMYPCKEPRIIKDILIRWNSHQAHIEYETMCSGGIERRPETWTFKTYAECTKWCEEQN